jgi:hypothetical protein
MVGFYLGAVALPLAVAALVHERSRRFQVVVIAGLASLLLALGSSSPVRTALNWLVPVFNTGRFPAADSRPLAALCISLMVGAGAVLLENDREEARRLAARVCRWLIPAVMVALLVARFVLYREMRPAMFLELGVNGGTAVVLFLLGALAVLERCSPAAALRGLVALLAIDLSTCLLLSYGNVGHRMFAADYAAKVRTEYQHSFEKLAPSEPRVSTSGPPGTQAEFAVQGMTRKRFDANGYGGFRLDRYERVLEAGLGAWLVGGPRAVALAADARPTGPDIIAAPAAPGLSIVRYGPTTVTYALAPTVPSLVVFNEIGFPGWRARVDGGPWKPMREVAGGLRAFEVPGGHHVLETSFLPRDFVVAAAVSLMSSLAWVAWCVAIMLRRRGTRLLEEARIDG